MDHAAWYQQHTGFAPDAAHFGAYAITPMTDTLCWILTHRLYPLYCTQNLPTE